MNKEELEKLLKENNIEVAKKMKPFPSVYGLEEDFKYKYLTDKGKYKYEAISVKTLVEYIFNKKFVGEYFYKDFATFENPFDSEKGFIKHYDKEKGIWKNAEEWIKDKIDEFFRDEDTKDIIKSCRFALNKDTRTSDNKIIYASLVHEMNKSLKRIGSHWNSSFEKEYLTIAFKNGTLFLFQKTGEMKFLEIKHQDFLTEIFFNTTFDVEKLKNRENRLSYFLREKIELDTPEKMDYFNAILFDFFLTENESHHTLFFIGKKGSGKSTFMKHIIGCSSMRDCAIIVDLQKLVGERFTNPKWFQYPLIFTNETREKYVEDNATFKQMVAKEDITIEQKMKDPTVAKPYGKIIGLGEIPFRIKIDGGADDRIINHFFGSNKLIFKKEDLEDYKEYYAQIKEKDTTKNDELLQFLAFEKYEDLTDILIKGCIAFANGKYWKNRRSFKKKYEELFHEQSIEFSLLQNSYFEKFLTFIEPSTNSFIRCSDFFEIFKILEISGVSKHNAMKEQLEQVSEKLKFDLRYFKTKENNLCIYAETTEMTGNNKKRVVDNNYNLTRNNQFIFGFKLKEFKEIKALLSNNKNFTQKNDFEKYNSINNFWETTSDFMQKLFPEKIAEKTKIAEIKEIEFKKVAGGNTPHGQNKSKVDIMAEELKNLLKEE